MLVIAASTRREGQRHAVLVHLNKAKNGLILRDPSKNPLLKGENVTELPLSEEQLIDLIGLSRNKTTDKGRSIEDLFKYTVVIGRPGAKAAAELPVKGYGTDARFSGLTAERRYEMEHQLSPEDRLRAIYYDAHPPAVFKDKALQKAWNRGMDKAFRFELIQLNKEPDNERHAYLDKLQRKFVARKIVSLEQDALIRREDTKFLCHQAELLTQLSEEEQHISSRFYSPDERAKLLSRIAKRKQHIQYTQSLLGDDKDGDRYIKENERDIRNLAADFEILDREMRVSEYLKPANIESLKKDIWDEYDKDPNDDNYTDPLNKVQKQIESFESIRTSNEFKNWLKEQTIDKINKINALIDADIAQLVDYGEAVDDIRNWFSLPTSNIDIDEGHRLVENYVRIQTRLPLLIARLNAQFSEAKISRDDEEEGENHQVVA